MKKYRDDDLLLTVRDFGQDIVEINVQYRDGAVYSEVSTIDFLPEHPRLTDYEKIIAMNLIHGE